MKHCPNCTNEFEDDAEISKCPDCDVELLSGPNPQLEPGAGEPPAEAVVKRLVVLTKVGEAWQADLLRGRLLAEGLETAQEPSVSNVWLHIPPVEVTQMIQILVNEQDLERGQALLKQIEDEAEMELLFCPHCFGQISTDDKVCPHCGRVIG